jgi:hypothetical protein
MVPPAESMAIKVITNPGAAYVFHGLPATAPLQNISIRADVLTGSEVLIAGFVISGTGNT